MLFVHQMKLGLLTAGLLDQAQVGGIEAKVTALRPGDLTRAPDKTRWLDSMMQYDGLMLRIAAVPDAVTFARSAAEHSGMPDAFRSPDFLGPAKHGNVRAAVKLKLQRKDEAVVLKSLDFDASCVGADREAYESGGSTPQSDGGFEVVTWRWQP